MLHRIVPLALFVAALAVPVASAQTQVYIDQYGRPVFVDRYGPPGFPGHGFQPGYSPILNRGYGPSFGPQSSYVWGRQPIHVPSQKENMEESLNRNRPSYLPRVTIGPDIMGQRRFSENREEANAVEVRRVEYTPQFPNPRPPQTDSGSHVSPVAVHAAVHVASHLQAFSSKPSVPSGAASAAGSSMKGKGILAGIAAAVAGVIGAIGSMFRKEKE